MTVQFSSCLTRSSRYFSAALRTEYCRLPSEAASSPAACCLASTERVILHKYSLTNRESGKKGKIIMKIRISWLKLLLLVAMSAFGLWASSMVIVVYYTLKQSLPFCPLQRGPGIVVNCNAVLDSRYSMIFGSLLSYSLSRTLSSISYCLFHCFWE